MNRNVKECDVFGTLRNVDRIRLEITADPLGEGQERRLLFRESANLGIRAQARLVKYARRGLAPPVRKTDSPDI